MRDLLICALATAWVLVIIRIMRTRRHSFERQDHIDRDFRDLVRQLEAKKRREAEDPNGVRRWFELLNTSFKPGD